MFVIEKAAVAFILVILLLISAVLWDIYMNVRRFVAIIERVAFEHEHERDSEKDNVSVDSVVVADGTGVIITGRDAGKRVPKEDRFTGAAF